MMRVSVTELDAYRKYRDSEDVTRDELVERLLYRYPPTPRMLAGRRFHAGLEFAQAGIVEDFQDEGYLFTFAPEFDATLELPPVRELKASRVYLIDGKPVELVGVVDAIDGLRVDDHKFSVGFTPETFLRGYQWRCYLDIFAARWFRWNVFVGKEAGDRHYQITALHRLEAYRYPGLHEDVVRNLTDLARFVRQHVPQRARPDYRKRAA
jgi:hypothetical protein